jgi:uncharacterized protein (TIGR03435 family)
MTETIAQQSISSSTRRLLLYMAIAAPLVVAALYAPSIQAQTPTPPTATTHARGDISGDWQGAVEAGKSRRLVVRITKADKGWAAKLFLLQDEGTQSLAATGVLLDHSTFKFAIDQMGAAYEGTLSADETSMAGTFTMGAKPYSLTLARATKETAWEIPPPPQPSKPMDPSIDPAFEVATIKPSSSTETTLQGVNVNGRNFTTRNTSLADLMSIAYGLHARQIVDAPGWADSDRYDIAATFDHEGAPNLQQLQTMITKLLVERFSLKFHHDKRDLSAFVLTVAKTGPKLTPTEVKGSLPGFNTRSGPAGMALNVRNASMTDFTTFLRTVVLDRPVVDQTALTDKFDFIVKFMPDDSEFNGHAPKIPAATDTTEVSPDLFKALQEQVGLKLSAEKLPVDVLVIDHVEKPSPN